jgi:hypothetical protein
VRMHLHIRTFAHSHIRTFARSIVPLTVAELSEALGDASTAVDGLLVVRSIILIQFLTAVLLVFTNADE